MRKIIFIIVIFIFSCGEEKATGDNILEREKFVLVLTDMHLTEAEQMQTQMIEQAHYKKGYAQYMGVFKKHGTDTSQVRRTFEYYSQHEHEDLLQIYREVKDRLVELSRKK